MQCARRCVSAASECRCDAIPTRPVHAWVYPRSLIGYFTDNELGWPGFNTSEHSVPPSPVPLNSSLQGPGILQVSRQPALPNARAVMGMCANPAASPRDGSALCPACSPPHCQIALSMTADHAAYGAAWAWLLPRYGDSFAALSAARCTRRCDVPADAIDKGRGGLTTAALAGRRAGAVHERRPHHRVRRVAGALGRGRTFSVRKRLT